MEIDSLPVMLTITIATGHLLQHLDLAVDDFTDGVGDSVFEVGQDIRQMSFQGLSCLHYGCQPRMSSPKVPSLKILLGAFW